MGHQRISLDWESAWTLEDYLFELFEMQKTETSEFKTLLGIYGREKMASYYKRYQEKKLELVK